MSVKRKLPTWTQLITLIKPKDINYYSNSVLVTFVSAATDILNARTTNNTASRTDTAKMRAEFLRAIRIDSHWSHANAVKLRMLREQTILRPILVSRGPLHSSLEKLNYYGITEGDMSRYLLGWYSMYSHYTTGHPHASASTNKGRVFDWKSMSYVFDNGKKYHRADYTRGYLDTYYLNYLACLVNPHSIHALNKRLALACGNNKSMPILQKGRYVVALAFKHSRSFIKSLPRTGYDTMKRKDRDKAVRDIRRQPVYRFFRPSYNNFNLLHFGVDSGLYLDLINQTPRRLGLAAPAWTMLNYMQQAWEHYNQSPYPSPGNSSLACFVRK